MNLDNKTLRILQYAPREIRITDLYINYNTLTLPSLHKFSIVTVGVIMLTYLRIFGRWPELDGGTFPLV